MVSRKSATDRLRITDRRIQHQRLSGEEQQALDAARFDHREREGVSARSDEDRDAALENVPRRLGRSERDAGCRLRSRIFTARPRPIGASRATSSFRRRGFRFPEFRDYSFYDSLLDEKRRGSDETVDLGEQKTDADGKAEFDLQLDRFADATYLDAVLRRRRLKAKAVAASPARRRRSVSALPYVVGYKTDGDLNYINAEHAARASICSRSIRNSIASRSRTSR